MITTPLVKLINTSSNNSLAIDIIYFCYIKLILLHKERLMLEKKLVRSRNKFIQFYKISRESQSLYRCRYCFPRIACIIKFGAVHKPCAQFAYNTFSWEMILQRELQSIRLNLEKKLQKFLGNDVRNCMGLLAQQSDLRCHKLRSFFESLRKQRCSEVFQSGKVNPNFTQRAQDIPWRRRICLQW